MIGNAFRSFIHAAVPGNGRDWQCRVLPIKPRHHSSRQCSSFEQKSCPKDRTDCTTPKQVEVQYARLTGMMGWAVSTCFTIQFAGGPSADTPDPKYLAGPTVRSPSAFPLC